MDTKARLKQRIEELSLTVRGHGYSAIRAKYNLEELNKLTEQEKIEAFKTWEQDGSIK